MRSLISTVAILVFAFAANAQAPRLYQGEPHIPYIFEPYQADYVYRAKFAGMPFKFLSSSTRIIEVADAWEEKQKISLDLLDYFPDKDGDREDYREVELTQNIDLKTGLLRSISGTFGNKPEMRMTVSFADDGKITVTGTDGKRTQQKVYENREKIYPCTYSNAFLSYLPLDDNFAGTFTCVDIDGDSTSAKNALRFTRRTLRVVGSETVRIDAGTFDCYKLSDEAEEIKYNADGTIKSKKKISNSQFDENKIWRNVYSGLWIDKRTRKVVKAELNFKIGDIVVELQRSGKIF